MAKSMGMAKEIPSTPCPAAFMLAIPTTCGQAIIGQPVSSERCVPHFTVYVNNGPARVAGVDGSVRLDVLHPWRGKTVTAGSIKSMQGVGGRMCACQSSLFILKTAGCPCSNSPTSLKASQANVADSSPYVADNSWRHSRLAKGQDPSLPLVYTYRQQCCWTETRGCQWQ